MLHDAHAQLTRCPTLCFSCCPQAYFSVVGNGEVDELGINDGDPLPGGRQPDASCVVQV